jgi:hypothetical protein
MYKILSLIKKTSCYSPLMIELSLSNKQLDPMVSF